ncbi:MAG: GxxExxY protein [Gammaproteobacteria bacterium]
MVEEKRISERVIECAQNVSRELGAGFLETVYENALALELDSYRINYRRQKDFDVCYRNTVVGQYRADYVVENKLIIELKALSILHGQHEAQVMNYLRASGLKVGLLLNFGTTRLGIRRVVWDYDDNENI